MDSDDQGWKGDVLFAIQTIHVKNRKKTEKKQQEKTNWVDCVKNESSIYSAEKNCIKRGPNSIWKTLRKLLACRDDVEKMFKTYLVRSKFETLVSWSEKA